MKRLMDRFFEYFSEQLGAGKTTPLTGSEMQTLLLFRDWASMYAPEYAAAPELLAACKDAVAFIKNEEEFGYTDDSAWEFGEPLRSVFAGLEAAIAKAEGEGA